MWLATEPGHKYIPDDQKKDLIGLTPNNGWKKFRELASGKVDFKKYKTIPIDTLPNLYGSCLNWTCESEGMEHPSDQAHGKGWSLVRKEFTDTFAKFLFLTSEANATVILICHTKVVDIETQTEKIKNTAIASLPGQLRDMVVPIADHIWFLGYADDDNTKASDALIQTTTKRCLYLLGDQSIEAGTRDNKVNRRVIVPLSKKDPFAQIEKEMYELRR